jgi:hypothetical protein
MVDGEFFINFYIYLFNIDRVSAGHFVFIFNPTDKYTKKSSTVFYTCCKNNNRKIVINIVKTTWYTFFSLLRIKGLYMFRALFTRPQEASTSDNWYIACVLFQLAATGI